VFSSDMNRSVLWVIVSPSLGFHVKREPVSIEDFVDGRELHIVAALDARQQALGYSGTGGDSSYSFAVEFAQSADRDSEVGLCEFHGEPGGRDERSGMGQLFGGDFNARARA
jgi:hypothetical protein